MISSATRCILRTFPAAFSMRIHSSHSDILLFTKEQRKAYTTEGGCHHLDGNYTVYGELIEGFDVLDIIAGQPRDEYDRPKKDIRIIQLKIEN